MDVLLNDSFYNWWYVLYVRYRHEKKVDSIFEESNIQSFLPLTKTVRISKGKKIRSLTPLFSSYVFVKMNNKKEFYEVMKAEGVISFIKFGKDYAKIRNEEINKLKLLLCDKNMTDISISSNRLKSGDIKQINFGPLSGYECEIIKVDKRQKVLVRLDAIGQSIMATIPRKYL